MVEIFRRSKYLVKQGCHIIINRESLRKDRISRVLFFVTMAKGDSKPRHSLGKTQGNNELGFERL